MQNHLTVAEIDRATLGIDADHLSRAGRTMPRESFAHLVERLFAMPIPEAQVDGRRVLVANKLLMPVSTAIDLLQCVVGPPRIKRPIGCWVQRDGRWAPIRVRYAEKIRVIRDYKVD